MPTYVYACSDCQHRFEVHQAFTDDALTDCPECEGRLRKQFGSVGVVFKGSGFYRTDSRGGAKASGSAEGSTGGSTGSAAGSGSSGSSAGSSGSGGSSSSSTAAGTGSTSAA